jgi:hypothetical protein
VLLSLHVNKYPLNYYYYCVLFVSLCWLYNRHLCCLACTLISTHCIIIIVFYLCLCAGFIIDTCAVKPAR